MKSKYIIIIGAVITVIVVIIILANLYLYNKDNSSLENNSVDLQTEATSDIQRTEEQAPQRDGGGRGADSKPYNETLQTMINSTADKFIQLEYVNEENGISIPYNLYIPENYDANKEYPLVTFIHDSSVTSDEVTNTLTQGFGALVWATDEEQAKHESFVLAPQYQTQIVNDNHEINEQGAETINLIYSILDEYSIDRDRLYITGQSMGCMTSMYLNIQYPDLFTASLYVAGQWDENVMDVLADDNIFYIVSEGDTKASPGMDNFRAVLDVENASYSTAIWNGKWNDEEFDTAVAEILSEGNSINLVKFVSGTVIPDELSGSASGGAEHIYTWDVAYLIEGVRDWLFEQSK